VSMRKIKYKYLITGSTGFIGSVLLRKLINEGNEVHIILRKESHNWRIKDLLDKTIIHQSDLSKLDEIKTIIKKSSPDIIYHLATNGAYSYQNDANQIIQTNFLGTWNLLQACNEIDYKLFVNTGSSSEYGFKQYAMRETDIPEPNSYYSVTKASSTMLCSFIATQLNKPIVTIRPFSVYGPYEEPTRFVPTLMKSLMFNTEMKLVSPNTARDFIYVDDMVNAYLKINELKKHAGEVFNIGSGLQSTLGDFVNLSIKISGKTGNFQWGAMNQRSWDSNTWVSDISKARAYLHWAPKVNLEEGIKLS